MMRTREELEAEHGREIIKRTQAQRKYIELAHKTKRITDAAEAVAAQLEQNPDNLPGAIRYLMDCVRELNKDTKQ